MDKSASLPAPLSTHCLNCGAALTGTYCATCGQKNIPRRQTFGELLVNFIGSFTSFESKFFRTVQYLLFRPGFLAMEYNRGRREAYYHPARAYVFISFIYFLVLFWTQSAPDVVTVTKTEGKVPVISADAETNTNLFGSLIGFDTRRQYDSAQQALPAAERDGWFMRTLWQRGIALRARHHGDDQQLLGELRDSFMENFPKMFFLSLPLFALLLKLLYRRRDFYYTEHLVFTINHYNFFFMAGAISMLLEMVPWLSWIRIGKDLWIFVYLLLAMKHMYGQSWGKTVAKYVLLLLLCFVGLVVGSFVSFFVTIFVI